MSNCRQLVVVEPEQAPHFATSKSRFLVCKLAACGLDEREIAYAMGLQPHVVRAVYADELTNGLALVTGKVGAALVHAALRGDTNAARFFLQSRAKWVVPTKVEMTGKDGGPIEVKERQELIDRIVSLVSTQTRHKQDTNKEQTNNKPTAADPAPEQTGRPH